MIERVMKRTHQAGPLASVVGSFALHTSNNLL